MSSSPDRLRQNREIEEDSVRSGASSIVTTSPKFSISTLPNEEYTRIDDTNRRSRRSTALRPRSIFSVASYEPSLPPYDVAQATATTGPSYDRHNAEIIGQPARVPDSDQQSPTTSVVDPENALSMHYGRVVRVIDQNHLDQMRRLKEAHQEELGKVRHAIDQTYRKEFKARDREMEKMREEMASLTATHEARIASMQREVVEFLAEQAQDHQIAIDKACNAIEDVWESRWNDRIRLADEEARNMESEHQVRLNELEEKVRNSHADRETAVNDRDRAWVLQISKTHPELKDELENMPATLAAEMSR